jgi:serine/threonine-protein kinase
MPITRTGVVIGTPAYLAPEQIAGDRASPASDLYALGVVGYECLTGMPPFRGAPIEVAAAHRDRPLPPLPASVPAAAASLVAELTRKDPAARPAAAADVAARASQLRDAFAGGAATALAEIARSPVRSSVAAAHPATLVDANPPTWHGPHQQAWTAAQRPTWQGAYGRPGPRSGRWPPDRSRRHGLLAATAVVLVAALGVLVLVAILPGIRGSPSVSRPSREVQTVRVNDSALVGEPVSKVTKSLRQLGLTPTIAWTSSSGQDGQDPGTVISVDPSGFVPAGSTVIVTAVFPMPGSGHGHNNGGDGGNGG